ncbi:MAG: hypothetical protein NZ455_02965 [Bacteroidia bacterium]|nr:hypothetical protein [Bacteroidia bacterium]MDW8346902.1 hypothetical protein [Bacteroidia bacterium]
MQEYKLEKIARELSVSSPMVVTLLKKQGFFIEDKPDAKITYEMYLFLCQAFGKSLPSPDAAEKKEWDKNRPPATLAFRIVSEPNKQNFKPFCIIREDKTIQMLSEQEILQLFPNNGRVYDALNKIQDYDYVLFDNYHPSALFGQNSSEVTSKYHVFGYLNLDKAVDFSDIPVAPVLEYQKVFNPVQPDLSISHILDRLPNDVFFIVDQSPERYLYGPFVFYNDSQTFDYYGDSVKEIIAIEEYKKYFMNKVLLRFTWQDSALKKYFYEYYERYKHHTPVGKPVRFIANIHKFIEDAIDKNYLIDAADDKYVLSEFNKINEFVKANKTTPQPQVIAYQRLPEYIKESRKKRLIELTQSIETLKHELQNIGEEIALRILQNLKQEQPHLLEPFLNTFEELAKNELGYKSKVEELQKHIELLKNEQTQVKESIKKLKNERETEINRMLQEKKEEIQQLDRQIETLKKELQPLIENHTLIHSIDDLHQKKITLEREKNELEQRVSHLQNNLKHLENKVKQIIQEGQEELLKKLLIDRTLQVYTEEALNLQHRKANVFVPHKENITAGDYLMLEDVVKHIKQSFHQVERPITSEDALNYLYCFTQEYLTLLCGRTGVGKSSLVKHFASVLGLQNNINFCAISVQKTWNSTSDYIGFFNAITRKYEPVNLNFFNFLQQVHYNSDANPAPFICLMDEMNLAQIEYYWAEFLNQYDEYENRTVDINWKEPIKIGDLLSFVGTINIDHTTSALSPRLISRAMVIHIEQPDSIRSTGAEILKPSSPIISKQRLRQLFQKEQEKSKNSESANEDWNTLFGILDKIITIDARIKQRMLRFYYALQHSTTSNYALDHAVLQNLVPSLQGFGKETEQALLKVYRILEDQNLRKSRDMLKKMLDKGKEMGAYNYFDVI